MGMENFGRQTDPAIVPENDSNTFWEKMSDGNHFQADSEENSQKASDHKQLARSDAKLAAFLAPTVIGGAAVGLAALEHHLTAKSAEKSSKVEAKLAEEHFAEARNLIDIEAARRVAAEEGVYVVRPEDVK